MGEIYYRIIWNNGCEPCENCKEPQNLKKLSFNKYPLSAYNIFNF